MGTKRLQSRRFDGAMGANADIVRAFCAAWGKRDLDAIGEFLADEIFYHNIPMAPIIGRVRVLASFAPLVSACSHIEWDIHHMADAGAVVLTERTDHFVRDGRTMSVRVMGTFEIDAGRIIRWRDYFDLMEWQRQIAGDR